MGELHGHVVQHQRSLSQIMADSIGKPLATTEIAMDLGRWAARNRIRALHVFGIDVVFAYNTRDEQVVVPRRFSQRPSRKWGGWREQAHVDPTQPQFARSDGAPFTGEFQNALQDARASLEPCNCRTKQAEGLGQCVEGVLTVNIVKAHLTD